MHSLAPCVQWSVTRLRSRVQSSVRARPPFAKELFQLITYYARVEQGDNPGQEKEGSTVSSIICNCCWVVSYAGVAEAERLGWLLAGATHSTSQDLARR